MIATNSFIHAIGSIFQPVFHLFAWLLATLYGLIPNYAIAIALLTLIIMGALTPFTVKSTRSMMAMQRIQPELKKIQQKYKGPENRQTLNEEMMKLYKEEGVNPLGGCLPMLVQAPFLFILYSVIRGLTYSVKDISQPRYIPKSSKMYHDLILHHGQIKSFGIDLALKPFSRHSSWVGAVPFFAIAALAVALQYFQMWQMNTRNRKSGQAIPSQQQMIQRIMPVMFAYFYIVIPAAVVLYMVMSTIVRIATQDIMFRTGVSDPQKIKERQLPARNSDAEEVEPEEPTPPAKAPNSGKPASRPPAKKNPQPSTPKPQSHPRSKSKRPRKDR